jgi:hypothetical protein
MAHMSVMVSQTRVKLRLVRVFESEFDLPSAVWCACMRQGNGGNAMDDCATKSMPDVMLFPASM